MGSTLAVFRAGFGSTNNYSRPNYISGCDPYAGAKTVTKWFNPACYTLEPVGTASGPNSNAGRITSSNPGSTPRQIQFGLKLNF
jgi:hypothetical protein